MSVLRKYKKGLQKNSLQFPMEMYTNVVGSLVLTHYILNKMNGVELDVNGIKATWKHIVKKGLDFWLDDPDFIKKVLELFGMEPIYGKFAMVQSQTNVLFLPYIDEQILPIRPDGIYPASVRTGKIYPITEHKEEGNENIEQRN